jgi:hypothetical protein
MVAISAPNVAKATALLHPLEPSSWPIPMTRRCLADDAFDLVTSRHPATVYWSEIVRCSLRAARTSLSTLAAAPRRDQRVLPTTRTVRQPAPEVEAKHAEAVG